MMTKHNLTLLIFLVLSVLTSCGQIEKTKKIKKFKYLHLSHTRIDNNPAMVDKVESADFSKYDMLWLGGDMAFTSSISESSMQHIDSILDVKNPNTLWSLGNHDYTNVVILEKFTKRPRYYTYHKNRITILVLDTQDSLSSIVGNQLDLVKSVCDTINESTHLIVLSHKLIWMLGNKSLESQIPFTSNGRVGDCFHCLQSNNFYTTVYPILSNVAKRGTEVILIGGDIGMKTNQFEYKNKDGIHFLASGIDYTKSDNKVLIFYHNIKNNSLKWKFESINDL